jgi:hypothetical protein
MKPPNIQLSKRFLLHIHVHFLTEATDVGQHNKSTHNTNITEIFVTHTFLKESSNAQCQYESTIIKEIFIDVHFLKESCDVGVDMEDLVATQVQDVSRLQGGLPQGVQVGVRQPLVVAQHSTNCI